jgi:hypothetical protein
MKTLKTLLVTKSIIAAAAIGGIVATAGTASAATGNQLGTPNDGMVCRSGYTPSFSGTALTCRKEVDFGNVSPVCANLKFPNYVIRSGNGVGNDKDVCAHSNVFIPSNGALPGKGDFDYVTINQSDVDKEITKMVQAEATALGLQTSEVEWTANLPIGPQVGENKGKGGKDAVVYGGHFNTFPIKTGLIINSGPVTIPGPFVPRALP